MSLCLQSLLCGPSLSVGSVGPLMERLSEETLWGFSLHLLCATRRGQYGRSIEKLLDRCPQAIIAYANHQLQDKNMVCAEQYSNFEVCFHCVASVCLRWVLKYVTVSVSSLQVLWWQKLLPELCNRTRAATDNGILLAALKGKNVS